MHKANLIQLNHRLLKGRICCRTVVFDCIVVQVYAVERLRDKTFSKTRDY